MLIERTGVRGFELATMTPGGPPLQGLNAGSHHRDAATAADAGTRRGLLSAPVHTREPELRLEGSLKADALPKTVVESALKKFTYCKHSGNEELEHERKRHQLEIECAAIAARLGRPSQPACHSGGQRPGRSACQQ